MKYILNNAFLLSLLFFFTYSWPSFILRLWTRTLDQKNCLKNEDKLFPNENQVVSDSCLLMDWIGNEKHCASHLIYFFRFTIYIASDCQAIINSEEYISEKDYYFRFANFTEELKSKILTKEQDKKKK